MTDDLGPEYVNVPPPVDAPPPAATLPPPFAPASGLTDNVAAALAYVTIIPAILFLVLEPYNRSRFVRFNAFQCIALTALWFVASLIWIIPFLGWILGLFVHLAAFVAWVLCIINAYQGKMFKLPVLGDFAENLAK